MRTRRVLLTTALVFLLFSCATSDQPETVVAHAPAENPAEDEEPSGESAASEGQGAGAPTVTGEAPSEAPPPQEPPTETPRVAETGPAEKPPGTTSPPAASSSPAVPSVSADPGGQGSADTTTASLLRDENDDTPPSSRPTPVSAPVVSEPWNQREEPRLIPGVIDDADVVAFYGHPLSFYMGILGEKPLEEMAEGLREVAREYDAVNGPRSVVPAFHIIYATAYADANVGVLNSEVLTEYIEFAEEHDFAVILDHQLGKHDVVESVRQMLPYLKYSSVHLAIDPEWSTLRPNEEIGSVRAEDINEAQRVIQEYLEEEGINQRKMFVVHQFNWVMIEDRPSVRSDFDRVDLVHNADGFGPPRDKHQSWDYNRAATNIPLKGFKLFYPKEWREGGYDDPLMTPEEVLSLDPRPVLIMYQ